MTTDQVVIQFSTAAPSSFIPFTRGWKNRYSKVIRTLGHTYFSHVDFVNEQGNLLGASNNPDSPYITGNPRGVALRPPDYQQFGIRRRMIIRTDRAPEIWKFARDQLGLPFDSGALSRKVFFSDPFYGAITGDRDWRNPEMWFCAELVLCSFEEGGYWGPGIKVPILKNRVTPADLYMVFMMDRNFINRAEFMRPFAGLRMGKYET